ncbi:MAG: hypothetical protein JWQ71_2020, partial [Pedosphaera sp.]|nr:hypothetical protein [Pedosphaera sp.]
RKATGSVTQGQTPGGRFDVTGNYDQDKEVGQFDLKLVGFNENALRPFLASALGDKRLESISVNATASAGYNAQAESSVKADFQLANLIVSDPKQQIPKIPLEAKFQVDASLKNKVADIRQFQFTLTPTERAKNELSLTGQVDLSQTNGTQGTLKLTSQALDVTRYYDLFAGKKAEAPTAKATPAPSGTISNPQPNPNAEPAAVNLPLRNSSVDVNIARFYLRELEITNLQTTAKIDGGHVLLKPFQLAINGAPVNATVDLNLGVPGYQYDVNLSADKIPIAPLANSFSADYKDRAKGDLIANVQLKGAGTTGASLQKSLAGQLSLVFTNANIQLAPNKFYKNVIGAVALALQEPGLTNSPVNYIVVNTKMGEGNINLNQFRIVSDTLSAQSQGVIPIATVLTNSPINNWPVEISLKRSLAQKARVVPADAPTNTAYVTLPTFVTVKGTIGDPNPQINKVVIAQMIAQATGASKIIEKEAGKYINQVPGLGGLLGGKSGTNQPASTNKPSAGNVLGNILSGIATNRPQANTNPPSSTNKPSGGNIFDLLPKIVPK